jgi:hypothetical protein
MKLSRAVALAADGVDLRAELLRATAQALTMAQRATEKPPRGHRRAAHSSPMSAAEAEREPPGQPHGDAQGEASRLATNLRAVQASRSLLMRTIDMLK